MGVTVGTSVVTVGTSGVTVGTSGTSGVTVGTSGVTVGTSGVTVGKKKKIQKDLSGEGFEPGTCHVAPKQNKKTNPKRSVWRGIRTRDVSVLTSTN